MTEIPDGFEIQRSEEHDQAIDSEPEFSVCANCGSQASVLVKRGKEKGFCDLCKSS